MCSIDGETGSASPSRPLEPAAGAEEAIRPASTGLAPNTVAGEWYELPEDPAPWDPAELARAEAGPWLAFALAAGEAEVSSDEALLAAVVGYRQVAAWATAHAARTAAALADRQAMNPEWPATAGRVSVRDVTGEELALALGCSRRAARHLVRDGRAFEGALTPTGDALARGDIDPAKARVLVEALVDAPVPLALDVQDAVLPEAGRRTPTELSRAVAKAIIAADPAGARSRRECATRTRRVDRPRFLPDGMAGLWAVLPAERATRMDAVLDRLARSGRAAGDPRTLDQLRADLLVDLATGTVPRTAASNEDQTGTSRDVTEPIGRNGPECTGSGSAGPAARRVGEAIGHDAGESVVQGEREPGGRDTGDAIAPRQWLPGVRAQINVLVPLDVLRGASDAPAELVGYGPITAEAARELATGPDSVWRRLATDPLSGAVLDVGRTRYRPPAALAEHVRARDRRCVRPGCSVPATSCDLDHTVEYGRDDGPTAHGNLGPLCRRDHQVKTDGGYALTQLAPGLFEWVTPLGRRYRIRPGPDGAYLEIGRHDDGPPPF